MTSFARDSIEFRNRFRNNLGVDFPPHPGNDPFMGFQGVHNLLLKISASGNLCIFKEIIAATRRSQSPGF
jgi:hypothetical protein